MLQALARHPKLIAWFFTGIFYLELVLVPAITRAESRYRPPVHAAVTPFPLPVPPVNNATAVPDIVAPVPAEKTVPPTVNKEKKSPAATRQKEGGYTTGPTQPEMQSFQSVNANELVDLFSGDFSYNIPLLDVGGYPVNLHYQSGITMDQEASWVGLGWNINPGVISRNMRGVPDDFQGGNDAITKTISMKPNRTIGVTGGANIELAGKNIGGNLGISAGIFHNTYKGWGTEFGLNANINSAVGSKGALTGGLSIANNSQNGLDVSPSLGYQMGKMDSKTRGEISIGTNFNSRTGIQGLQISGEVKQHTFAHKQQRYSLGTGFSGEISFSKPSYTPTITVPFTSDQYALTFKVGTEHWALHPNGYIRGYTSVQKIEGNDKSLTLPAYGYLYYEQAGSNQQVLLDFNREKDIGYSEKTPHIAVPIYTYDTYSITGEGTGGMFRPYRGDIGYVFDHAMSTKSNSNKLSLDVGFGSVFHAGVDFNKVYSVTKNNPWLSENAMKDVIGFRSRQTDYENVYFKNPGEKTAVNKQYLEAIGDDNLVRVDLSPLDGQNESGYYATRNLSVFKNSRRIGRKTITSSTFRQQRDKRTQVISYLNATEATHAGLDRYIKNYPINSFPANACNNYQPILRTSEGRAGNHISEITVLNNDGKRYVYGVPVYNVNQAEVSMSVEKDNSNTGLVSYTPNLHNSVNNNTGKEGYFSKEELPQYAHSFLLSGILSPDYVDITNDGITEDDNGDAVKFNYSRIYGINNPYKWRAPFDDSKAFYNEGLKTYSRDDRGSYTYGEREVWYLNSVESKTMMATFVLESAERTDGHGVMGENGGYNPGQGLKRLKEINLYAKADYLRNGPAAKPIKTVHFEYSYRLCPKATGSAPDSGKLTLEKVWFTYNKNEKGRKNPYVFTYQDHNPEHNTKSVDRWGSYKRSTNNPGTSGNELSNADYSYTLQDGVKNWNRDSANNNAAPWTLSQIQLPSGGRIKVTYETDDYAYVQNRRAMQFFQIEGFAETETGTPVPHLFSGGRNSKDYSVAFIRVSESVSDAADIRRKYLDGVNKLFFKLMVKMPDDPAGWGTGSESIPCYADIVSMGVRPNTNGKVIWVKLAPIKGLESPVATAAVQFLRLNLPAKAYPFSEPGDNLNLRSLMGMMATMVTNVVGAIEGFSSQARSKSWCKFITPEHSFARLDNPIYKKYGGGLRVKRVEVFDNWNKMTNNQMKESIYGQDYSYETNIDLNGVSTRISSGVASYEPGVGNDENPFKIPHKLYVEKPGAMAPADYMYSEEPFAETFFPSPSVGYSKVTVQTIHKTKKSANGLSETAFFTAKDFPTLVEMTPLDDESKKTYNPTISNIFRFDAKHYVTLSQGFKVELNDMNGKVKTQATYAQTDLKTPISYTQNYYRLENDNALQPKLSNKVSVVDSATGRIDHNAEIGKEVEIMVDLREQMSTTISGSVEGNFDLAHWFPPVFWASLIPLPSQEVNRYRAIAVLKVVNRYGILDSVTVIEKGSKVTTRNILFDGETGETLLSQTNNEFNDPLYSFNYPAYRAYSGMEPAYKNIGTVLNERLKFKHGKMYYSNGVDTVPVHRYFESGDELLVQAIENRYPFTFDVCNPIYYFFYGPTRYKKIWAINAQKGLEKEKGIFFIDANGQRFSADVVSARIIRSGKRNMTSVSAGSLTSLRSPIRVTGATSRLVFDSTIGVIVASAARFKDLWQVDSTLYKKDTVMILQTKASIDSTMLLPTAAISIERSGIRTKGYYPRLNPQEFQAISMDKGNRNWDMETKSWLRYDMSQIPRGAIVINANIRLSSAPGAPHLNQRFSNSSYLQRTTGMWVWDAVNMMGGISGRAGQRMLEDYFHERAYGAVETGTRIQLPETPRSGPTYRDEDRNITAMTANMHAGFWNSNGNYPGVVMMRLVNPTGATGTSLPTSRLAYRTAFYNGNLCVGGYYKCNWPNIYVKFYKPCSNGSKPVYSNTPTPGYYCYSEPVDTFVCRPNIDTTVNPYRWGIFGNWRVDRAYTYYHERAQDDTTQITDIRTDGEIRSFKPFWTFTNNYLQTNIDTNRWVWNSEMTLVNSKGFEMENHDPLNRYNALQHGYNRTLPVAVAQNSKSRNAFFEGFEDYDYRTDTCKGCPPPRFIDLSMGGTRIDSVSHTGRYSIRIPGNQTGTNSIGVTSIARDTITPKISMKIDSIPIIRKTVTPKGQGLLTQWLPTGYPSSTGCSVTPWVWRTLPQPSIIGLDVGTGSPWQLGICARNKFDIKWSGRIQPLYSETYTFYVMTDDAMTVWVNGQRITAGTGVETQSHNMFQYIPTKTINLEAGQLYDIVVQFSEYYDRARFFLGWASASQAFEIVPYRVLYTPTANTSNTVRSDTTWCIIPQSLKPIRVTHDRFSPMQGTKVVVSAWVKEDGQCVNGNYVNSSLEIAFNTGSPANVICRPKGPVIEGWQRIEDTLTVPLTATSATIKLRSLSSTAVFFDDVRMHPFNSNMKSYVYHPFDLRIMAELDDNNFATFYEYDDNGALIRVKKETERGIKTLKETRSALTKME